MLASLVFALIILSAILIPITALIDVLKMKSEGNDKLIWVLIILFMPIIGSLLYFTIGKSKQNRDRF